jgi:2-iminobutanoate/2-iminopropanoate deaminase
MMERTQINPWTWQDRLGYSQAWRVDAPGSLVFVAGQGPISEDGGLVGEGDFEAQARKTLDNLRVVLERAGASLDSIVKLTVYLTEIANLREYGRVRMDVLGSHAPAGTAVQVVALAIPGMLLEIDAVAVPS